MPVKLEDILRELRSMKAGGAPDEEGMIVLRLPSLAGGAWAQQDAVSGTWEVCRNGAESSVIPGQTAVEIARALLRAHQDEADEEQARLASKS